MSAARYVFRAELRHGGWRFVVGAALLLGIVGGLALTAGAGARRTASAFERLEDATHAATLLVNPEDSSLTPTKMLRALPGVEAAAAGNGLYVMRPGTAEPFTGKAAWLAGGDDAWFRDVDRPVVREGRLPDQSRDDEIFANPSGARESGLHVGDTVDVNVIPGDLATTEPTPEQLEDVKAGRIGHRIRLKLVGIGVVTSDVVPGADLPTVLMTTAYLRAHPVAPGFSGYLVRLRGGTADADDFIAAVKRSTPGKEIDFQTLSSDRATVGRAVRPQVIALVVFAVVLAVGAMLAVGQTLGRRAGVATDDALTLRSMGMRANERLAVDWYRLIVVLAAGIAIAVVVAAAASGVAPVGVARQVEPTPGFAPDWVVLGIGGAALAALTTGASIVSTVRARSGKAGSSRPSTLLAAIRRRGASPTITTGIGMALEPGSGRSAVPTRATLVTAIVGLGAVTASVAFAGSLDHFVHTPRSFGYSFDAQITTAEGDESKQDAARKALPGYLDEQPDVTSWSELFLNQVRLASGVTPAYGIEFGRGTAAAPTVLRGRLPSRSDEVALGASSMRLEHVDLGDHVSMQRSGGSDTRFSVVGEVVLPGVTHYDASDQPALGVGALFTKAGLVEVTAVSPSQMTATVVTLRDGTSWRAFGDRLNERFDRTFDVVASEEPADVASYRRVRSTPILLAALLGLLSATTVGHALVVAARRRRRDLAILRTVGLTPTQVSGALAWQATTVAVIAAGVGLPAGIIVGRIAWASVAHQLGVLDDPTVPMSVLLAIPAAIVFANLVALIPGRRAARLRPTEILRSE